MQEPTFHNLRIAILEDDPTNRARLSDLITMIGAVALAVPPPAPALTDLEPFLVRQRISMVVCDHRLFERGDYAPYTGADAIKVSYQSGRGGVLVTAYENADAESSIRAHRRWIPALVHATELRRAVLESALVRADRETRQHLPVPQRVPYRTLVTVRSLVTKGSETIVKVVMGQWRSTEEVGFPLSMLPVEMHESVVPGNMLIAQVNLEAERGEDVFFDQFELPDPDVLRKSQAFFDRP